MLVWPVLYAFAVAIVTSWDVLPPNSKAYDVLPSKIVQQLAANVSIDRAIVGWLSDKWRWDPTYDSNIALTWVNGINYTNAEMEQDADLLSSLFGCKVRPYYNPSLGWWLKDLVSVSYMYVSSPVEDPVVTGLAKHLKQVLSEVGPTGHVVHMAHSGGALLTYLVAKHHLQKSERQRIHVINFGGARSITRKYFAKAVNYYARNDPILYVNRRAYALMSKVMNQTDQEVIYLKHNTSFVFLRGRAQSALADHSLLGPTYMEAIQREAAAFRSTYHRPGLWYRRLPLFQFTYLRKPVDMTWMRYIRKRSASMTGLHGFFRDRPTVADLTIRNMTRLQARQAASKAKEGIRTFRKAAAATTGLRGFFSGKNVTRVVVMGATPDRRWWRQLSGNGLQPQANVSMNLALPAPPAKDVAPSTNSVVVVEQTTNTFVAGGAGLAAIYQQIRVVRKTVARTTGYHGFFSGKNVTEATGAVVIPAAVQEDRRWWLRLTRQPAPNITDTSINRTDTPTIIATTTTTTMAVAAPPLASAVTGAGEESRALVVVPPATSPAVGLHQYVRAIRKAVAKRTGYHGFFSRKSYSTSNFKPPPNRTPVATSQAGTAAGEDEVRGPGGDEGEQEEEEGGEEVMISQGEGG